MDRILRLRTPTDYSQDYKKRGISVDKRLLRAHHRTIDQRAQRDKSYMCRRGETCSPPKRANNSTTRPRPSNKTGQSKITEVPLKERVSNTKQTDKKNAPNSREDKLKKWKEEKLLKDKLKRNGKENKLFKVCKVKYDNPEFLSVLSKSCQDQKLNRKPATWTNKKKVEIEKKQVKQTKSRVLTTKGSRQSARIAAKKLTEDSMVHTLPDSSFAPRNFMFSAPGNVSTMQFVPMSPCSVQSFFCPSSKFNSTEVSSRRCSTPLSAKHSRPLAQALDISVIPTNGQSGNVKPGPPDNMLAPVFKLTDSITTRLRSSDNVSIQKKVPEDCPMSVVINTPTKKGCIQDCTLESNSGIVTSNEILVEQMSKKEENVHVPSEAMPESKPDDRPMSVSIPNIPAEEEHRQNLMQENNSVNVTSNDIIMEQISKDKQNIHVTSEESPEAVSGASSEAKPELSVAYFRSLLKCHTDRLQEVCDKWETELQISSMLEEEVMGDIRTSIGKAQLLIAQRFKQFNGLIDNCEFGTGLKETSCTDLQGFWEMVYIQIEHVDNMFQELDNLKANNWIKTVQNSQPKVKKNLKKKKVSVAKRTTAASEAAKQRLAAIKAAMKMKQKPKEEEKVVFEGGFFKVESPMKVNKQPHCQGGTPLRKVMQRSLITSPANVSNGSVCERPQVLQDSSQDRTASPYAFRTPRKSVKTPTTRTPASRTRSSAKKAKDPSSLMKNTPVSSSKFTDKSPIKTMELNNSISMFLQPSMNVVDLNNQAEELMVTEPVQQLNALKRTPLSLNRTRGKTPNSYSAKKRSSKKDIKKLDFINNFESPLQLKTSNDPLSSCVSTDDLICFDSPTHENGENVEYGLVERLAAISLPNKEVVFSPVRRSARFHHPESDDSILQPQTLDKILFSPLKEI